MKHEHPTMRHEFCEIWEYLTDYEIATDAELGLAVALCGRTVETLLSVLYVRTGYNTIEQLCEEIREENGWYDDME